MSISSTQSTIGRVQRDIADIQKKIATEHANEAKLTGKINQAQQAASKASTINAISSKMKEIERLQNDIAKCNVRKADLNKRLTTKTTELHKYQTILIKEEMNERKKQNDAQKKREKEHLDFQKKITQELEAQKRAAVLRGPGGIYDSDIPFNLNLHDSTPEYDVFISHASEDKEDFVRPFAQGLIDRGIRVWYDELSLRWGDSLRKNIDRGLSNSRYGIVVLSKNFIQKKWTEYELNGLVAAEIEGEKRILPIWHEISKTEVMKYSPSLADKLAMNTSMQTTEEIIDELVSLLS